MKKQKLMLGDNIESLKKLPDNSIDSVVTDPPYGLSFMGKKWDYDIPSVEFWKQVYRVLKPGGHILAFGGTRTYHRLVVNIEDAGFEIRDQIQWLYGSGFPKSLNVGKAVDKFEGNKREMIGENPYNKLRRVTTEGVWKKGEITGFGGPSNITKGQSEWEGWGSALKPANEPICLARKPLSEKSIAENILKWRTGGLNIDGCRIGSTKEDLESRFRSKGTDIKGQPIVGASGEYTPPIPNELGRFPANLILDETAAEMLDEQSGISKSQGGKGEATKKSLDRTDIGYGYKKIDDASGLGGYGDKGGASRFFYVAKVSKAERNMGLDEFDDRQVNFRATKNGTGETSKNMERFTSIKKNNHPTVKPVNLMSYLCKLVTPPNGIILDPFMGSGSTGIAALLNDFRFVGMEMDENYFKIAEARINDYENYRKFLKK